MSLWPVKPMKRTLPSFWASRAAFSAPPVEDPVRVVVVDLVELPEVDAVGLEPAEAVVEVVLARPGSRGRSPWS